VVCTYRGRTTFDLRLAQVCALGPSKTCERPVDPAAVVLERGEEPRDTDQAVATNVLDGAAPASEQLEPGTPPGCDVERRSQVGSAPVLHRRDRVGVGCVADQMQIEVADDLPAPLVGQTLTVEPGFPRRAANGHFLCRPLPLSAAYQPICSIPANPLAR